MIILGLGNPGASYEHTRHNVGFMVLDSAAGEHAFVEKKIFSARVAPVGDMIFAKPTTFMNESGKAAKALTKQFGEQLVVVYDDIDIALGQVKCSFGRGSGDHNGVQSVIDHLGHKDFFRIRVGVRPVHPELVPRIAPPDGFEKFLLSDVTPVEEEKLKEGIDKAVQIISSLPKKTFEQLMNEYNA